MSSKAAEGRSTSGRSRRELLAGAAGALGVVAAESLTRITPAEAGVDGDVVLGVDNQLTAGTTGVQSTASLALHGRSTASSGTGVVGDGNTVGVHGTGLATNSTGVEGIGGTGVVGKGLGTGSGVVGTGGSTSGTALYGTGGTP